MFLTTNEVGIAGAMLGFGAAVFVGRLTNKANYRTANLAVTAERERWERERRFIYYVELSDVVSRLLRQTRGTHRVDAAEGDQLITAISQASYRASFLATQEINSAIAQVADDCYWLIQNEFTTLDWQNLKNKADSLFLRFNDVLRV